MNDGEEGGIGHVKKKREGGRNVLLSEEGRGAADNGLPSPTGKKGTSHQPFSSPLEGRGCSPSFEQYEETWERIRGRTKRGGPWKSGEKNWDTSNGLTRRKGVTT